MRRLTFQSMSSQGHGRVASLTVVWVFASVLLGTPVLALRTIPQPHVSRLSPWVWPCPGGEALCGRCRFHPVGQGDPFTFLALSQCLAAPGLRFLGLPPPAGEFGGPYGSLPLCRASLGGIPFRVSTRQLREALCVHQGWGGGEGLEGILLVQRYGHPSGPYPICRRLTSLSPG